MAFYSVMLSIYMAMEGSLGLFVITWTHQASIVLFAVLSVLFVGAAYGLAKETVSLFLRHRLSMPSMGTLKASPKVAILYATMNDIVPECLLSVRQTYPSDVYVLDDSSDAGARMTVDRIAAERGYTVVRRNERRGFKAGAINDWSSRYGSSYDYIVLLDSDSYLPPDWVGEALKHAEHPANQDVAIFQGLINIWNLDTKFVRTLAPMSAVGQFVWESHLANDLDAVFCYGHNFMARASALKEIGGFVEGYVSEDFATAVALAARGWHSRFVPLHTYEAMPENIRGFIKRQNKWTRGSMEFFAFARTRNISVSKKFHLLQIPMGHIANLLLPVGALLTVYGFASTSSGASQFLFSLLRDPVGVIWSVPILRFLIIAGIVGAIPGLLVRRLCSIHAGEFLRHRWLSGAIAAIMIPYEFRSMLSYAITGLRTVPVTPKAERPLSAAEVLQTSSASLVLQSVLWAGIIVANPLGAVFNAMWLVPMMASPLVIMRFGGMANYMTDPLGKLPLRGHSFSLTPDPSGVNSQLGNHGTAWRARQTGTLVPTSTTVN
jgi:cellulose synthase/poly-beta-1,6-N-acetylglucosamine synthase-like glycosyltransferase